MTQPLPAISVNQKTDAILESLGPNTRWLVENSAVADRAYADMMAERARNPAPVCCFCEGDR